MLKTALFAAQAGARKVYAVELGRFLLRASKQNFIDNGYEATVALLDKDARMITLEDVEKPDVVISCDSASCRP